MQAEARHSRYHRPFRRHREAVATPAFSYPAQRMQQEPGRRRGIRDLYERSTLRSNQAGDRAERGVDIGKMGEKPHTDDQVVGFLEIQRWEIRSHKRHSIP